MGDLTDQNYRDALREIAQAYGFDSNCYEIDANAKVERSEQGAWIETRVWVSAEDAHLTRRYQMAPVKPRKGGGYERKV